MHALSCIGAMSISGGGAALHSDTTNGQRGAKAQPGTRLERLGGWPAIELSGSRSAPPRGTEFSKPRV